MTEIKMKKLLTTKQNTILKITLLSLLITLFSALSFAQITSVNPIVGFSKATFNWTTDDNTTGSVYIQEGNVLVLGGTDSDYGEEHSVTITGLLPETTYSYRIVSGGSYYPSEDTVYNITTTGGGSRNTLSNYVYNFPFSSNTSTVTITGEADTYVTILRNLSGNYYEQLLTDEDGNEVYSYLADGEFNLSLTLVEGVNSLRIEFTDSDSYDVEYQDFSIEIDTTAPTLQLVEFQSYVQGQVRLLGVTDPDANIQVYNNDEFKFGPTLRDLNDNITAYFSALGFSLTDKMYFDYTLDLSEPNGENNITLVLVDEVGNSIESNYTIYSDMEKPSIENLSIASIYGSLADWTSDDDGISTNSGTISNELWSPYSLIYLRGMVEDAEVEDVTVIFKNNYNDSDCNSEFEELIEKLDNISSMGGIYYHDSMELNDEGLYDFASDGYATISGLFGYESDNTNPNSDGAFEFRVSLKGPAYEENADSPEEKNHICLIAIDKAYNYDPWSEPIIYQPMGGAWRIDKMETEPTELYSAFLRMDEYPGSVMFELAYSGEGDFEDVEITKIRAEILDNGMDQIGQELSAHLTDSEPVSIKDESIDAYNVIVNYAISEERDANRLLEDQDTVQFSFKIYIDYKIAGEDQAQEMQFFQAVLTDISTPYDAAKLLTPEIVNDTLIPILNKSKTFLEDASNWTRDELIEPTFPVCLGLMVTNVLGSTVFKSFGGGTVSRGLMQGMKLVCDRIYSPRVPPKGPATVDEYNAEIIKGTKAAGEKAAKEAVNPFKDIETGGTAKAEDIANAKNYGYLTTSAVGMYKEEGKVCTPVFANTKIAGKNPLIQAVLETEQSGVYTVKNLASVKGGVTQYRCYSREHPFYDQYKCLGVWWFGGKNGPKNAMDPMHDIIDSVVCGSFGGFYLQSKRWANKLGDIITCLENIEEGLTDAGYCEGIMATTVCEGFEYLFERFLEGKRDKAPIEAELTSGATSFNEIMDSYGDAMAKLAASETGSGGIVHQTCMLALGMDVSDMDVLAESSLTAQDVKPQYFPPVVKSHLRSYDENTNTLQIQYMYSVYVQAGFGSDAIVKLELICDPSESGKEYCGSAYSSKVIDQWTVPKGQSISISEVWNDAPASIWYNRVKLHISYEDVVTDESYTEQLYRKNSVEDCSAISGLSVSDSECASSKSQADLGTGPICCKVTSLKKTKAFDDATLPTEAKDILKLSGLKFGCYFDVNSNIGFVCGTGVQTNKGTGLELVDVDPVSSSNFYEDNDIIMLLTLKKNGYSMKDFIVKYNVQKTSGDQQEVVSGAKVFETDEVFACPSNSEDYEGTTISETVLPIKIVEKEEVTTMHKMMGIMSKDEIEEVDENNQEKFIGVFVLESDDTKKIFNNIELNVDRIEYYFDGEKKVCYYDYSAEHKFSFTENSDKKYEALNANKKKYFKLNYNKCLSEGKITNINVYVSQSDKDARFKLNIYSDQEMKELQSSISITGKVTSDNSEGSYKATFELYYCDKSDGDCGDIGADINTESDDYKKIIFGSDENAAGQKKEKKYSIASKDGCGHGPKINYIYPLEKFLFSNSGEDKKKMTVQIYDDCGDELNGRPVEFKTESKWIKGSSLEKSENDLHDGNNVYTFEVSKDIYKGKSSGEQVNFRIRINDTNGKEGTNELDLIISDSDSTYPECWATGLSG
ncbi:hypothetical protein BVX95_01150 [archaeon D22]|nr:hypothetical protein BVX95_01150 [archaeon D22]